MTTTQHATDQFLDAIRQSFPDDRLTWQKAIPTFHPDTAAEAAQFIRMANEHRRRLFITGFGNNIDPLGEPFTSMVTLRTDRLNDLITVAPDDFYVTVGGGYPLRELNDDLRPYGLFLPHGHLPYVGSAGGAVAVNLLAQLNGHRLPIKKYLIKAEIVTPTGEIITPGSVCFKSVSGYDIVKLFAPSWGLLGLLASVTFRVLPLSAIDEFASMKMQSIDRAHFLTGLAEENGAVDAQYARRIKSKFDPNRIFPIV